MVKDTGAPRRSRTLIILRKPLQETTEAVFAAVWGLTDIVGARPRPSGGEPADVAPPLRHAIFALSDCTLGVRLGEHDGQRRRVVGEQNVSHAALPQLGPNRDVP